MTTDLIQKYHFSDLHTHSFVLFSKCQLRASQFLVFYLMQVINGKVYHKAHSQPIAVNGETIVIPCLIYIKKIYTNIVKGGISYARAADIQTDKMTSI